MSSVYLSEQVKSRLISAARRRGFNIERGRQSELANYIAYLISLDENTPSAPGNKNTLGRALGLLAQESHEPPNDQQVADWLNERRSNL